MNKKLIAAAVASVFAVPAITSADVSVYGALHQRVSLQDSKLSMTDGGTRFGFKSSTDMGNGNTVSGVIEVGWDATDGKVGTGATSRVGNVSYSGDWGSLAVGSMGSVMGTAQGHACPNSGQGCGGSVDYQTRVADTVQLKTSVGGFSLNGQVSFDGSDDLAGWAISTGIDVGSLSIGIGHRDYDTGDVTVVGASTTIAGIGLGAVTATNSANKDGWAVSANINGLSLTLDENSSDDQEITANYAVDLGGSTMKFIAVDNDTSSAKISVQFSYSL